MNLSTGIRRWLQAGLLLAGCLGLSAQASSPPDVVLAFRDGAVVVTAPAGAHLTGAFLAVKLPEGAPGRLQAGPIPPTNGTDDLGAGIWRGPVAIPVRGEGLSDPVELRVTYQLCTEGAGGVCYPPTERGLTVAAADLQGPSPAPAVPGPRWSFLAIFAWGVLASLTPCVYPMIPITMAVVGAKGGGRSRGLLLSLALVLGMAATYTLLGVLAASSGRAFGAFAQRPAFLIPVSLLFALFALSLLGAFELRLPAGLQARLQGSGPRKGLLGAFVVGLVLGPLSAPCVGPIVGSILLAIAARGQVLLGALQLFTFALGMGVLFLAVGTFSAALPRSGPWLVRLKQGMGLVVLGFAVWNLRLLLPPWLGFALWALLLLLAAAVLDAFARTEGLLGGLRKGLGWAALVVGLLLGVRAVEAGLGLVLLPRGGAPEARAEPWRQLWLEQDFEGALARARAQGRPLVVDVYAEWCAQCKELDDKTWPDARVSGWLAQNAVALRVDTDKVRPDLATSLKILGYPTVLVLDGEGKVQRRLEGFQDPGSMLAFLAAR